MLQKSQGLLGTTTWLDGYIRNPVNNGKQQLYIYQLVVIAGFRKEPSTVSRWTWELGKMGFKTWGYIDGFWRPILLMFFFKRNSFRKVTPPKTNSSHLKMDGWNTVGILVSFRVPAYFQVLLLSVSGRVFNSQTFRSGTPKPSGQGVSSLALGPVSFFAKKNGTQWEMVQWRVD